MKIESVLPNLLRGVCFHRKGRGGVDTRPQPHGQRWPLKKNSTHISNSKNLQKAGLSVQSLPKNCSPTFWGFRFCHWLWSLFISVQGLCSVIGEMSLVEISAPLVFRKILVASKAVHFNSTNRLECPSIMLAHNSRIYKKQSVDLWNWRTTQLSNLC